MACPLCGVGQLHLKTSRTGGFVGCKNYPECHYTRQLGGDQQDSGVRVLGEDHGDEISLRSGRFGSYIQRGDVTEEFPKLSGKIFFLSQNNNPFIFANPILLFRDMK